MKTTVLFDVFGKRGHITVTCLFILITQNALCTIIPTNRIITWQGNVGIPGGVPTNRVVFTTLSAGATMAQIQSALNACPSNEVVVLPAGTNSITGTLVIPSGVTLRGAGMGVTILNCTGSGQTPIEFGTPVIGEYYQYAVTHNIMSGCTKGSTNITLDTVTGISPGTLLVMDQLNDATLPVSDVGTYGTITWNSRNNGARAMGQTVEVLSINGTNVTFQPPMFWSYSSSLTPQAISYNAGCQWAGVENLTLRANNTGYTTMFDMQGSKYCWVKGVETDFADGDHGEIGFSFRCEVRDGYYHDGYLHQSGTTDTDVMLYDKTSSCLVENNVFYRMHGSIVLECGVSGNVIAYNYSQGNFDSGSTNVQMMDFSANHGAHPMFNLFEGNCGGQYHPDSYWGSSSHGTALRNWFTGANLIYPPATNGRVTVLTNSGYYASQGLRAICLDFAESYYNLVGNIVGSPWASATNGAAYMVIAPQTRNYQGVSYLFSLGYSDVSDGGGDPLDSTLPYTTLINHGNYDFVSHSQTWSTNISDQSIPSSYYLTAKPAWFGNLNWPPFDPANPATASITNLPAGYRFVYGVNPPAGVPNTNAPVISNVAASAPTTNSATISWITSEAATSIVDGGPTTAYGISVTNTSLVISHGLTIAGLSAGITNHFRVRSLDSSGNQATSLDNTVVTLPPPPANFHRVTSP